MASWWCSGRRDFFFWFILTRHNVHGQVYLRKLAGNMVEEWLR